MADSLEREAGAERFVVAGADVRDGVVLGAGECNVVGGPVVEEDLRLEQGCIRAAPSWIGGGEP